MNNAPLAGFGFGLPMSRLYARYLGGDLSIVSVEGFGTDALVQLKRATGEALEALPQLPAAFHGKPNGAMAKM
jgi:pyruvate dehydrogenase kinase 2/3/4